MNESVKVEGLEELVLRLKVGHLVGPALRDGLNKAGIVLQTEARKRAPVDQGRLRASILYKLDDGDLPTSLTVGAATKYAPFMEYGTGLVHDHPSWPRRRHAPPAESLNGWGGRHGGAPGGAIAAAIAKRGGLKPRRYLRGALEDNADRIVRIISGAIKRAAKDLGG